MTRRGALVRSGAVNSLTSAGWAALRAHGVTTIVDLRNDDEQRPDRAPRPAAITTVRAPLDGIEDREFWDAWQTGPQFGTPLYYEPFLARFPRRVAAVCAAIADADPAGAVLFHCQGGRDRTGLIAVVLLALAGVAPDDIAADYALSEQDTDDDAAFLATRGTSAHQLVTTLASDLDVPGYLAAAGLSDQRIIAIHDRLLAI